MVRSSAVSPPRPSTIRPPRTARIKAGRRPSPEATRGRVQANTTRTGERGVRPFNAEWGLTWYGSRCKSAVLGELRKLLPFALLGFDTDNDRVFMNETVRDYCQAAGVQFTRCRPYRKNDQAWVEQKNGAVVRHSVGYRRYEGLDAAAALARLYASLRLFVNFFQPSFKLGPWCMDRTVGGRGVAG